MGGRAEVAQWRFYPTPPSANYGRYTLQQGLQHRCRTRQYGWARTRRLLEQSDHLQLYSRSVDTLSDVGSGEADGVHDYAIRELSCLCMPELD